MGKPVAEAAIRTDNRKLRGDLAKAARMFGRTFKGISSGIRSQLGGALSLGGIAGGVGVAAIGRQVLQFEEGLTRLGIQANKSGKGLAQIRTDILDLSRSTGQSRESLLEAATSLVNLQGASGLTTEKMKVLAKANDATGATMADLAGLTLALDKSFGITNAEDLQTGLGAIVQAGKEGAIPLNEMAMVLQQVGGEFANVTKTGQAGAIELAAALQVLRSRGFASAAEAGTGLASIIGELGKGKVARGLAKNGIKVFDDSGKQRQLFDILREIQAKGFSDKQISDIFGRKEAKRALRAFGKEGIDQFDALTGSAAKAGEVIEKDAATFRKSVAGRLRIATNALKENIADAFTPERIERFIGAMGKIADLAGVVADNIEAVAAAFVGIKIASFAGHMAGVAMSMERAALEAAKGGAAMSAQATQSAALATNMGKAAKGGALLGAALAGYSIGTAADQALGLSDKISDFLADSDRGETVRSGKFRGKRRSKATFSDTAGALRASAKEFRRGGSAEMQRRRARQILENARASGVLGAGGKFSALSANRAAVTGGNLSLGMAGAELAGVQGIKTGGGEELVNTIRQAAALLAKGPPPQNIRITVTDDRIFVDNGRTGGVE